MNGSYVGSNFSNGYPSSYISNVGYGNSIQGQGGQSDRFIGAGFAFPFLLGGVTGAAIAPAFWRPPYNRPFYGPGPIYSPYYGPYRPF